MALESVPHQLLARLVPEVREYTTPRFVLQRDLNHLNAVIRAEAPEAVILYSARILEALAGDALRSLGQAPGASVFGNLAVLEHLNRFDTAVRYWAHALRRLGNLVRHIDGQVGPAEATLATLFAEGWLDWFFCRFSHGQKLASLTLDQGPFGLGGSEGLRSLMRSIENLDGFEAEANVGIVQREFEVNVAFSMTPVLAAVVAEVFLGCRRHEEAFRALNVGLARFPDDRRLHQLMGLYHSRTGDLDQAIAWLGPLYASSPDDEETAGITAGVLKRGWLANRARTPDLEKSHQAYRHAWKVSGKSNLYLGINSATTALWLGRVDVARRLAREVEQVLHRRAATLPRELEDDPRLAFHYWDQVTLAEAQLLQGQWETARQLYRDAFTRHPGRSGDIAVSREQRDVILDFMGRARMEEID
jgi:tetratricopeptide (TPR) repeat protein